MLKLSFTQLPHFIYSNLKRFLPHEKHMWRLFTEDVLILMLGGTLRFTEDGIPIELHAGEYYIQRSGLVQDGPEESDCPVYYYFHFSGHYDTDGTLPLRGHCSDPKIRQYISKISQLGFDGSALQYEMYFYAILNLLANGEEDSSDAARLKAYIIDNYQNEITLQDLAKAISLSVNQTINIFKAAYKTTPHKYLTDFRLEQARELILTTSRPFATIAFNVGMRDYSLFFRAFRAKYHLTPSELRDSKASHPR